jgi:hypothetical protein
MTRIKLFVYLIVLLSAMPVGAQYYTNYPTLDEPIHYLESYYPEIRLREDQTQAAFLLILLNLVSPRDEIKPHDMAPPEDLEAIGLSERLYNLLGLDEVKFSLEAVREEFKFQREAYNILSERLVYLQGKIAEQIAMEPNQQDVARLAVISFVHPDPLVRIAAAPLLIVLTDDDKEALEELRRGTQRKDQRLSLLAATLLARFSAHDSALDQLVQGHQSSPGREEEPKTTTVVHGTWASSQSWWRNGYPFFEYMEHDIPVDDLFLGDDPFAWSGNWSANAREQAAMELTTWAAQHNEICLNVVAHSHGSNVALLASNSVRFGRMILLSTPAHPHLYSPGDYRSLFSLRVRLDLVVLADGGGNKFPEWSELREKYFGWFNHSATHNESRWAQKDIPGWLTDETCP